MDSSSGFEARSALKAAQASLAEGLDCLKMATTARTAGFPTVFHELFVMEVNLFYKETLNKVGSEHPSNASRTQCWALVTKLLRTVFKATHGVRSFATEAGGPSMDPLQTNGYFLYVALEELRVWGRCGLR
jgi:hypothetical protein